MAIFHAVDPSLKFPPINTSGTVPGIGPEGEIAAQPPLRDVTLTELKPGGATVDRQELEADLRRRLMLIYHPVGTARMSVRPQDGVVGTDFAVHGTRNLFVVDSSIFPTNTGVNPQHTIMGVAMLAANRISEARL